MLFWFITFFCVYGAILAFVTWQAWKLRKILRSPSWAWRIAGFLVAFVGIVGLVGLTLAHIFETPPFAPESRHAPVAAYFILGVLFWRIVSLACFAVEQSLLRRSLERLFQKPV